MNPTEKNLTALATAGIAFGAMAARYYPKKKRTLSPKDAELARERKAARKLQKLARKQNRRK